MKNTIYYLILFVLSCLPLCSLFNPGLPLTHDGVDHVARIAHFYNSLSEGIIIPRWAGNLNWGYGHPIFMFLYPFPSYFASFFHFLGFNFVDSTKIVFGISFIASILSMFLWSKNVFGKQTGLIISILYGFAPYRFVDMYVRGAIGEHVAFIFPPIIFYFIYKLSNILNIKKIDYNKVWINVILLSVFLATFVLSHNAISIMFMPLIVMYAIYLAFYNLKFNRKIFLFYFFGGIFGGLGLSAFFWVPAFFEGKYTLRDIVTRGEINNRFVPWSWFIYSPWNYGQGNEFTKSIGLVQVFGLIISFFLIIKNKIIHDKYFFGGLLVILFVSLFLMTGLSGLFWNKITLLQKFQFPWRFLSISVFVSAILSGWSLNLILEKIFVNYPRLLRIIFILVILTCVFCTFLMWKPKSYVQKPDVFYTGIYYGTTDTGESSPIWSVRFMEKTPNMKTDVIEGDSVIIEKTRTSINRLYQINSTTKSRILENTLYFPGWMVYVNGKNSEIEFQDPKYRGLITYFVEPGLNTVIIKFTPTKLRLFGEYISMFTCLIYMAVLLFLVIRRINFKNKLLSIII